MSLQAIKDKLTEYEAAIADRTAKQDKHQQDSAALAAAIDQESQSKSAWLESLGTEHRVEDELEALVVAHEPPDVPMQAT